MALDSGIEQILGCTGWIRRQEIIGWREKKKKKNFSLDPTSYSSHPSVSYYFATRYKSPVIALRDWD